MAAAYCANDSRRALIVKAHCEGAGPDPAKFVGRSLRAGFLTSAARRGANLFKMTDVSRYRSVDALPGCIRKLRDASLISHYNLSRSPRQKCGIFNQ
jgi:hypothetical protein